MIQSRLQKLSQNEFDPCWSILDSWPEAQRQKKGFGQSREVLNSFLAQDGGYLLVVDESVSAQKPGKSSASSLETIAGFCVIKKTLDIAEILLVVIDQKWARQGLGAQMLASIIDDLQNHNFAELWLEVHADNAPAQALYRKHGFVMTSKRPKYYPDGADALNLKLAFKTPLC